MGFLSRYITSEMKSALKNLLLDFARWLQQILSPPDGPKEGTKPDKKPVDMMKEWDEIYRKETKKYQKESAKETAKKAHEVLSGRR